MIKNKNSDISKGPKNQPENFQWSMWNALRKKINNDNTVIMDFPGASVVKNLPSNAGDAGSIPGLERSPEEEKETHSSILAWEISWTEGYSPWDLKRVGHDSD